MRNNKKELINNCICYHSVNKNTIALLGIRLMLLEIFMKNIINKSKEAFKDSIAEEGD
jgi:hypothetical protein